MSSTLEKILEIPGGNQRFAAMEGLRAYAALVVFMVHFTGRYAYKVHDIDMDKVVFSDLSGHQAILLWLFSSHYGVDLFFLLSGFLIFKLVNRPEFNYLKFIKNRLLRIYPVFAATLCIYIAYNYFQGGGFWPGGIVGNLLFINGVPGLDFPAYNVPTWSLFFEFAFYLIFPSILLFKFLSGDTQQIEIKHLGWLSALLFVAMLTLSLVVNGEYIRFMMFMLGALLALMDKDRIAVLEQRLSDNSVLALYCLATFSLTLNNSSLYFIPIYALPCLLLTVKVVFGKGWLNKVFKTKVLRYIGNVSLSFYLIHAFALSITFDHIFSSYPVNSELGFFFLALAISVSITVGLAIMLFALFERPYFLLKTRMKNQS